MDDLRLTTSGRYYVRNVDDTIEYYDLDKKKVPLANGKCGYCGDIIKSKKCGDFVSCSCEKSFVDTDRWFPEYHRYGGDNITDLNE